MTKRMGMVYVACVLALITYGCAPPPAEPVTPRRLATPTPIPPMADGVDLPVIGDASGPSSPTAAWDGQGFFLAWDDSRTNDVRVAATRIDTSGAVVDPINLLANQPVGNSQYHSAVAFGAGTYLLAWQTFQPGYAYIQAARFDSAGKLLDTTSLRLSSTTTSYDGRSAAVAFDGTNFVVAWLQSTSSSTSYLQAVRVPPAGAVLDAKPLNVVTLASSAGCNGPKLAYDGAHMVLAWDQGGQISFIRLGADLGALDATPVAVGGTPAGALSHPSLAGNGSGFLVAWHEAGATVGGPAIKAQAWSADAVALGDVIAVESATSETATTPAVGFDGATYTLAWSRGSTYPDVYLVRLVPGRGLLMPVNLLAGGDGQQYGPTVAAGNGHTLIAWFDNGRIVETVLDGDGAPVGPRPSAALAVNGETKPAVASNGNGFMVAWLDTRDAPDQVYAAFLDGNAAPLASAAVALSNDWRGVLSLAVASDGAGYLAAWTLAYMSGNPAMGRLFDASGKPVGDELTLDTTGFNPTSAACAGGVYFVVGTRYGSSSTDSVGVRVDNTGHVLDATPLLLTTGTNSAKVASDGSNFLAIWGTSAPQGLRVGANGTILDATPLTLLPATAKPSGAAAIAFGGGVYLIAWVDSGTSEVMAVRLNPDGTLLDQAPIQLTSGTSSNVESYPSATFNGTNFVVAWENILYDSSYQVKSIDFRYTTLSPEGVAAMTVAQLGALDPANLSLDPVALVGGGNGKTLAAYSIEAQPLGYVVDRVKLRYLAPATVPAGGRCTSNSQCTTAVCVDSVCCQTACSGGLLDCQACSMSAGAATNGTCGPIADSVACGTGGTCSGGACLGQPDAGSDAKRDSAVADSAVADSARPPVDAPAADTKADAGVLGVDAAAPAGADAGDARPPFDDAADGDAGDAPRLPGPDAFASDAAAAAQSDASPTQDVRQPASDASPDAPADAKSVAHASSGCTCRMAGAERSGSLSIFVLGIALAVIGRRRARRDRRP